MATVPVLPLSRRCLMILACLPAVLLAAPAPEDWPLQPPPEPAVPTLEFRAPRVFKTNSLAQGIGLSADGKSLIAADDPAVRVWDTRTGKEIARFERKGAYLLGATILSPDGRTVAFTIDGPEHEIQLFDVGLGKVVRTLRGHRHDIPRLAFSPDGKLLASAADEEGIKLWDTATGKDLRRFTANPLAFRRAGEIAFAPDGKTLAVATQDGAVHLLDVAKGKEFRQLRPPWRWNIPRDIAFSPDGRLLALGYSGENSVPVWDLRDGRLIREHAWPRDKMHSKAPGSDEEEPRNLGTNSLAFTANGQCLMAACEDLRVRAWETATGGLRYRVERELGGLSVAPAGSLFAAGLREKDVCLWDLRTCLPPGRPTAAPDMDKAWTGLAEKDAAAAYTIMRDLMATPREAVALLDRRLPTAPRADPATLARLVADLDDDSFEVRDEASRRLGELGEAARAALTGGLTKKPSAEARRRIKELLDAMDGPANGDRLRLLRALEVLESVGTPEARRVLKRLAGGEPSALLTREAKAALARLDLN
jgi:WD40 repeat protein